MKSVLDSWLERISYSAQIAVAIVAIFGYFYTVRPIYQKELLSESIAKMQLEVSDLERTKKTLEKQASLIDSRLEELGSQIEIFRIENTLLASENEELKAKRDASLLTLAEMNGEIDRLNRILIDQKEKSEQYYTIEYVSKLKIYSSFQYSMKYNISIDDYFDIEQYKCDDTNPYSVVQSAINMWDKPIWDNSQIIPVDIKKKVIVAAKKC
ncbi:hypothetical protein [Pseudodesulfovibrio indicus]|uniref:hypothetical protein n=1 Tax=Pseudodesulfovibrio indicus TaxID=1716143 RepID=UPI00292EC82A|nr:hypothetical protein [Pseudodesulfovibrio indicus]